MEVKENKTLQKILDVANTEFFEKGFRDASLREIVKKAGVTTGAFYGYLGFITNPKNGEVKALSVRVP